MKLSFVLGSAFALCVSMACCANKDAKAVSAQEPEETIEEVMEIAEAVPAEEASDAVIMLQPGQSLPKPGEKPVIVDLFATWCGPCQQYGPIFDKVAEEYKDKAVFVRVDTDQCPEIAAQFNVDAIPTTVFLTKDSGNVKRVGLIPEEELKSAVESMIN